jgi:CRISPR/Cas system-associated endonuclease Cas1
MLNYGYAVLESETRIGAVTEDMTHRGITHDRKERQSGFIFDLMEPERPKVDRRVLEFVMRNALRPADFRIGRMGCASSTRKWRGGWCRWLLRRQPKN